MTHETKGPKGVRDAEQSDAELEALVAKAMGKRGDLPPTTEDDVLSDDSLAFEGELPPSLESYVPPNAAPNAPRDAPPKAPAASLAPQSKPRERAKVVPLIVAFSVGAVTAAAAIFLLALRMPREGFTLGADVPPDERGGAATSTHPPAVQPSVRAIGQVFACADCCAGSECAAASPELRSCPTGRTCVACGEESAPDAAFRLRLGNFQSANAVHPRSLEALDICVRVGGSPWSCEPAYLDAVARPLGRVLPMVARAEDLTHSVEIELRVRGAEKVYGSWRSGLRLGPTALCRGVGVVLKDAREESMGGLSLFVEDAFWVEITRADSRLSLASHRRGLAFADVVPSVVAAKGGGFALVVGPLPRPVAERLRGALLAAGEDASVTMGSDYEGAPEKLP